MSNEGVAAVDRALSILDAFTENDPSLTLSEISKRTGFYKSTTLRLAESLEKFGYLRRVDSGAYKLGPKTLFLGGLYQKHFRTAEVVPKALEQIVATLNEGASFFIRSDDHRVCLHRANAARSVRDAVHEGDRLPLDVGASGHVLLAFSGAPGKRYEQIRQALYSASFGERDPETAAVSMPVFGPNQSLVGALTVSGPRYRIEQLGVEKILPVLGLQARELTAIFGGNPEVFGPSGEQVA
jgi:DNA-binding IclR family transcriptional regulator